MEGFGPTSFGERYADEYDAGLGASMDAETRDSVEALAELARGGRVLELAIGTGRVALPLAARGLEVHGIEASEAMVAKMRAKPGGKVPPVTIGDMADAEAAGTFDLVFLVFNTLFNLTSQDAQLRCFANASKHLRPGGVFVVETFVPDLAGFVDGKRVQGMDVTVDGVRFEVATHDPLAQTFDFQRVVIRDGRAELRPLAMRYAWPGELDLMARLAGLRLQARWAGWDRAPFTATSRRHVSVYEKPEGSAP